MSDSLTLTLAGTSYTIKPLTIGQLRDLQIGVAKNMDTSGGVETLESYWKRNVAILVTALSEDYQEITEAQVLKMRLGTRQSVDKAIDEILFFSGLVEEKASSKEKAGSDAAGEALAGA
jgi:hypothetical protein